MLESQPPHLMVEAGGVGYELQAPMSTFYRLPSVNQAVVLHTHLVVREDAQSLFGFWYRHEKTLFQCLIKANGVGPKLALAVMSAYEAQTFVDCIHNGDINALVQIPGVGKKTAERLIIDLADRLKGWSMPAGDLSEGGIDDTPMSANPPAFGLNNPDQGTFPPAADPSSSAPEAAGSTLNQYALRKDAESALTALGYRAKESNSAVTHALSQVLVASKTQGVEPRKVREEVIRVALQSMLKTPA